MLTLSCPRRAPTRLALVAGIFITLFLIYSSCRQTLHTAWTLAVLPFRWNRGASSFVLSRESDDFDVTFANYSATQTTAGAGYADRVPAVMHHIMMGHTGAVEGKWNAARQSCVDMHPGWDAHLWTDETANAFVAEKFPELKQMWDEYPYPIQRIDALRHMLLYEYGGVVLDMDLRCRRSLGPLRRFAFVAPEAHPVGVSVGFMMAERRSPFVESVLANLATYNRRWLGLPYPTVMFSTGCHFVSTIHSLQQNRTEYKVLRGPKGNPKMHQLNGAVSTPLFDHLGSSKWHSFDSAAILLIGKSLRWTMPLFMLLAVGVILYVAERQCTAERSRRRSRARKGGKMDLEECSPMRTAT